MKHRIIRTLLCCFLALLMCSSALESIAVSYEPSMTGALWTAHFSDPYFMGTSMTSTPVVTGSSVYVVNKDTLYELDRKKGTIQWQIDLAKRMNSVCDPILDGDSLYIPLSDGVLQCVDIRSHSIRWTGEPHLPSGVNSCQTLGRLSFLGGYLYAGTWCPTGHEATDHDVASDGTFFCIDPADGHTVWSYRDTLHPVGFYWTKSVSSHGRVFFTSEDGTLVSHDPATEKVYETKSLTEGKQLRCGLCADENGDNLFTVSKDGILIRVQLSENGTVSGVDRIPIFPNTSIVCTSTPARYGNTIYFGCSVNGYASIAAFDTDSLHLRFLIGKTIRGDIKSCPLIVPTGIGRERNIFFTINENSGSAYMITDDDSSIVPRIQTLFTPYRDKQYCLANLVCGSDGTLYYSNDSGTLFALGDTFISSDEPNRDKNKKKKLLKKLRRILMKFFDNKNTKEVVIK
ncbi:MAG: PQQ-binding-like beta-propeller repeat protein [Eubacterium sp.]|nr:PQQ-binding-like beta-propeller repeat protein [Eubacterium sp.]